MSSSTLRPTSCDSALCKTNPTWRARSGTDACRVFNPQTGNLTLHASAKAVRDEPVQRVAQSRFTRARAARDRDKLAVADFEINSL